MDCLVCSFCFRFIGSVELQIGRKLYLRELGGSASHGECDMEGGSLGDDSEEDISTEIGEIEGGKKVELPIGVVESLMNGGLKLPFSDKFSLPSALPCHGGCGESYYCR